MKISKSIQLLAIGLVVSTTVWATSQDESSQSTDMPKMKLGHGMMMNPEMMQQMMASGQYQNMPMMNHQAMHQMAQQMPFMGHGHGYGMHHGMPMTGGGMGNMMMNPQMMQMRMQHMANMEQYLQKIESLLTQILEAQKSE